MLVRDIPMREYGGDSLRYHSDDTGDLGETNSIYTILVDVRNNTEEDDSGYAEGEGYALAACALEGGDGGLVAGDPDRLDYEEVVVERNDGVDKGDEYKHVKSDRSRTGNACEHEYLREESCEGGNTGEGEHGEGHGEGEPRVGLVKAVVVVHADFPCLVLDHGDYGEHAKVADYIYEDVEEHGGESECIACHGPKHDIAGLGDGGEGHEAFHVLLSDCEEVADGDSGDDYCIEHPLPYFAVKSAEALNEDDEEGNGSRTFRHYGKIGSDGSGSTLIYVGCPEMERHEGEFKTDTCEHEGYSADKRTVDFCSGKGNGYIIEIE